MSKELEALARQKSNVLELRETKFVEYADDFALIEQALKRNEPMKLLIKEDKFGHYDFYCPSCKIFVGFGIRKSLIWNYCPKCGQKLDSSDEK